MSASPPSEVDWPAVPVAERAAVGFSRLLRSAGISLSLSSTISFVEALNVVGLSQPSPVYWAGRSTLIQRPEDIELYNRLFDAWWRQRQSGIDIVSVPQPVTVMLDTDDDKADDADDSQTEEDDDGEIQQVRFSRTEVLTNKDFAEYTPDELNELNRLLPQLRFATFRRRSRRMRPAKGRGDRPDLRRTVRKAIRHHGEPIARAYQCQSTKPRRLVLVLDVSGSMEPYARALIRFAHAATVARAKVEVFALGTRLTRLTRFLSNRDPDAALQRAFPEVKDWAGGTRLGDGIEEFNQEWGIRGMARGAVVVVMSDGWDRGDPAVLGQQMERLHRVTHRLVWVNPLKATPGYAPLAAGMAASLPHLDQFVEGHSFASLTHLAAIIAGTDHNRNSHPPSP